MKKIWNRIVSGEAPGVRYYAEIVVALVLFVQGVLVVVPEYDLPSQNFWSIIGSPAVQEGVGITLILASVLIFVGLAADRAHVRRTARRAGTMLAFLVFTLLTFVGILSEEVNDVYWLATAGLAVLSSIIYVRVGRRPGIDE